MDTSLLYEVYVTSGAPRGRGKPPLSPGDGRIGDALRARRLQLDKRQEDLAFAAGLSQKLISELERGTHSLLSVSMGNVIRLSRALNWSLAEMQRATGVDLGVMDAELVAQGSADVYALEAALNPGAPGLVVGHDAITPGLQRPLLLRADTDEMVGTSAASIRPGSVLHVEQADTTPEEGRVYVITDQDGVHVRIYTTTRLGAVFRAENRSHEDIPASEAAVIGRIVSVATDYNPNLN